MYKGVKIKVIYKMKKYKLVAIVLASLLLQYQLYCQSISRFPFYSCPEISLHYGTYSPDNYKSISLVGMDIGYKIKLRKVPRFKFGINFAYGGSDVSKSDTLYHLFQKDMIEFNNKYPTYKFKNRLNTMSIQIEYILLRKRIQPYLGAEIGNCNIILKYENDKISNPSSDNITNISSLYIGGILGVDFLFTEGFMLNLNAKYRKPIGSINETNIFNFAIGLRGVIGKKN